MMKILILPMFLACISLSARAESNDTYNFYFQKAPGPVTVNQGAGAAAVVAPSAVPPTTVAPLLVSTNQVAAVATDEPDSRKKFFLSLGYAITQPSSSAPTRFELATGRKDETLGGQFAIRAEYDLGERVSLSAEAYKLKREVGFKTGLVYDARDPQYAGYSDVGATARASEKNVFDFGIGAAVHLVRLRSTTLSAIGGVISTPSIHYSSLSGSSLQGVGQPLDGVSHVKHVYAGARLRLLADNAWGLDLSYRSLVGLSQGTAQLGLTFAL